MNLLLKKRGFSKLSGTATVITAIALLAVVLYTTVDSTSPIDEFVEPGETPDSERGVNEELSSPSSFNVESLSNGFSEGNRVLLRPGGRVDLNFTEGLYKVNLALQECSKEDIGLTRTVHMENGSLEFNRAYERIVQGPDGKLQLEDLPGNETDEILREEEVYYYELESNGYFEEGYLPLEEKLQVRKSLVRPCTCGFQ